MEKKFQAGPPGSHFCFEKDNRSGLDTQVVSITSTPAVSIKLISSGLMYCLCYCQKHRQASGAYTIGVQVLLHTWGARNHPIIFPGLFCSGLKDAQNF